MPVKTFKINIESEIDIWKIQNRCTKLKTKSKKIKISGHNLKRDRKKNKYRCSRSSTKIVKIENLISGLKAPAKIALLRLFLPPPPQPPLFVAQTSEMDSACSWMMIENHSGTKRVRVSKFLQNNTVWNGRRRRARRGDCTETPTRESPRAAAVPTRDWPYCHYRRNTHKKRARRRPLEKLRRETCRPGLTQP